jgi:hypothetical protein
MRHNKVLSQDLTDLLCLSGTVARVLKGVFRRRCMMTGRTYPSGVREIDNPVREKFGVRVGVLDVT